MKLSAVVTGGASGIGLATVARLIEDGWPVALLDADAEALAEAEERFQDAEAAFLRVDVTDEEEVSDVFDQVVDLLGPIGGLVTSAGIARDVRVEDTSAELFRQVLDVNLVGTFICAQAAVERMGDALSIVTLGSVSGARANKGRVAYGASKAGVRLVTEVMATELASRGVRVNSVAPGPVDTPLVSSLHTDEDRRHWIERVPQRRYAEPEEIAAAIGFLLSPEASFVNGHTLVVDGGFTVAGIMRTER